MRCVLPGVLATLLATGTPAWLGAVDTVSFSADVQPILVAQCAACHGGGQTLSEFDLTTPERLLKGGLKGAPVAPGQPGDSLLYRYVAGLENPRMPLGGALEDAQIEIIRAWIEQGAPIDDGAATLAVRPSGEATWWAFQSPVRHQPPPTPDAEWRANPIDQFVHAKLRERAIEPAQRADKRTLIRRAYLDLTGLLPSREAVASFVADDSPDAWANLIDQLLASPRYGERWGRHWLDAVRYADSGGYEHDYDYPHAWRYRDYVIAAFNSDKPYDRFLTEQLAGDELEDWSYDTLVATGYYRIGPRILFREKDNPDYRYNYLDDMIGTTSRAMLGLTVDCARCHDHKFDPVTQVDYYRMMAVFYPHVRYDFPLAPAAAIAQHEAQTNAVRDKIRPLQRKIAAIEEPYRAQKREQMLAKFPVDIQEAVRTPEAQRTEGQRLLAEQVLSVGAGSVNSLLSPEDKARIKPLRAQIEALEEQLPDDLPRAMGVRDGDFRSAPDGLGDQIQPGKGDRQTYADVGPWIPEPGQPYHPPPAYLLHTPSFRDKGPRVEPGVPAVFTSARYEPRPPANGRVSSGRRLALARWITSPDNPLTARAAVNRVWQHHFRRGIVATAGNFGKMGTLPTHPRLLDWLATEFVREGWSLKQLHRLIMTSRTYQLASASGSESGLAADPENRLLWHFPQRRLEAEAIRDIVLVAAGSLNLEAGGEPFFPPIPQSVRDSFLKGRWQMTDEGPDTWRRSVYSYWKRGLRYPMFEVFDQPNMNVTCERRSSTTVPTQALTLLNNEFILRQAEAFANRIGQEAGAGPSAQIERAYEVALSRPPTAKERDDNLTFLARQREFHAAKPDPAQAALVDLCDVILNLNEFVYLP